MMRERNRRYRLTEGRLIRGLLLLGVLLTLLTLPLMSSRAEGVEAVARFTRVQGRVNVLRGGAFPAVSVKVGDSVFVKDMVRTKSGASAELRFFDGTVLKIAQRSRVDISEYVLQNAKGTKVINLPRGRVEADVAPARLGRQVVAAPERNRFEIHTPNAVAGVRGTRFVVFVSENVTGVLVTEGIVHVLNQAIPNVVIAVKAGQMTTVSSNQAPQVPTEPTKEQRKVFEGSTSTSGGGESSGTGGSGVSGTAASVSSEPIFSGGGESSGTGGSETLSTGAFVSSDPTLTAMSSVVPPPPPPTPPPAVEVGRTTLSGSLVAGPADQLDYISVIMNDVVFLAPSTGQPPTIWKTDTISGSYRFGPNITNGAGSIPVSNGKGITGNFNIGQWGNSAWSGTIDGQGNLSGGSYNGPTQFQGSANGSYSGATSGTFSGTGSGTAK